jgi:MFS family permease
LAHSLEPIAARRRWLFGLTIFLGAFLLFWMEPMLAKMILPWFGGTAAVWTVCLVFFQTTLLAGYAYAHWCAGRRGARWRAWVHAALLGFCVMFLPLAAGARWKPVAGEDPSWRLLILLAATGGVLFFVLSASGPLLQAWYTRAGGGDQPYWLFAVSNTASLAALIAYPLIWERVASTQAQARAWSWCFGAFAVLCGATCWLSWRESDTQSDETEEGGSAAARASRTQVITWVGLAACGSMLLLAVTNHVTQNLAPVPLLWVVPLALYLVTFVLAFQRKPLYPRWIVLRMLAVLMGAAGYALYNISFEMPAQITVLLFFAVLFAGCLFCHGELSLRRPEPRLATAFYLAIAAGGAIGAAAVGLIAPRVFDNYYELTCTLVLIAAAALALNWKEGWAARALWATAAAAMIAVLVAQVQAYRQNTLLMSRNFYGALRVEQTWAWEPDATGAKAAIGPEQKRTLLNGTITHGAQFLLPPMRMQPTTYYSTRSGIGFALRLCCSGPKRVGVIGLGAGTLTAYGKPGDTFRFYEINPVAVDIAQSLFTYLRESPAKSEIVMGDARLSLEAEPPQHFDVLAIDAFSGDAIPVHLLTRQAMSVYLRHMRPDGILAFHVSNQFLQLAPVVEKLAQYFGLAYCTVDNAESEEEAIASAKWVLVTHRQDFIDTLAAMHVAGVEEVPKNLKLWTDDSNSLFDVLAPLRIRH